MSFLTLFVIMVGAAFRVTRMITRDTIFDPIRDKIPDSDNGLGYLVRCDWCAGVWVSGLIVGVTQLLVSVPLPVLVWLGCAGFQGLLASWEK